MSEREAKSRAVKILAKSIYRDLEAQGFDEKQIVALATELISEVTSKMARTDISGIPSAVVYCLKKGLRFWGLRRKMPRLFAMLHHSRPLSSQKTNMGTALGNCFPGRNSFSKLRREGLLAELRTRY